MIQGEIYTFPLADLIQWVALTRRTGTLVVDHGVSRLEAHFSAGKIAALSLDLISCDSRESVFGVLAGVLRWRWGHFSFKDSPLPEKILAANLGLATEPLMVEIVSQHSTLRVPKLERDPIDWRELENSEESVSLANTLRLNVTDRLLREDFRVPPMPEIVTRVLELTRHEYFSLRELTEIVITDHAVVALILRYANSALHTHERQVDSLSMAVQRLGTDEVVNIALAASLQARQRGRDLFAQERRRLWERSSGTALITQSLASKVGLDPNLGFLCGLLMDFGMTVLYTLIQEASVRTSDSTRLNEQNVDEILRLYHQGVGRTVGQKWRLPNTVIECIAYHHEVERAPSEQRYVAIAALADLLATFALKQQKSELETGMQKLQPEHLCYHPAARLAGLEPDQAAAILSELPALIDRSLSLVVD